ncbi:hypothetical protein [Agrobacterium cavarae]|uniref:hypothetical protein n=1 Tax=Agrobacterium cavarae TaxID=2528239 RepID=UPI003EE44EBB
MDTNLTGRLRNLVLPRKSGLIPLFEAVVNSVHAIEERFQSASDISNDGLITIKILRQNHQLNFDSPLSLQHNTPITGFEIVDNGIGFNDQNWTSFKRLDFTLKTNKGCKGIGRLTWLKAFRDATIESRFTDQQGMSQRNFTFSSENEITGGEKEELHASAAPGTRVLLRDFEETYADAVEKSADTIATRVLEHMLWYFVREGGVPRIVIQDDAAEVQIDLNDVYDKHMNAQSFHEEFLVKGVPFSITHVKFRLRQDRKHVLAYCAGQRPVVEETLDLTGLTSSIEDEIGPYRYAAYIFSAFLDDRVSAERTSLKLNDDAEDLFAETEISRKDIREAAHPLIKAFLGKSLQDNLVAGRQRINEYVKAKAPHYLPIIKHLDDEIFVDPSASDSSLDKILHTKKYQVEQSLLSEGNELLNPRLGDDFKDYSDRVARYMERLQSVKQSDLAAYVAHRRVVLDLLKASSKIRSDGTYEREAVLHNLIMPMKTTSEDFEHLRASNLWLLDERLAFHQHYLGSEISLSKIPFTDATGGEETDIVALNIYDNPHLFGDNDTAVQASITIIEIKRPMRDTHKAGEKKDPLEQALGYLRKIRAGANITSLGRKLKTASELPAHIYVLADLTDSMKERCEYASLHAAPDGLSYFGWNPNPNIMAYIEVIDFDGLLHAASQRNAAFFNQLGLPQGM